MSLDQRDREMNPLDSQKIRIFRSIFMGREDAYGLESSPSPITVRETLTDSLLHDHLKGSKRIGVFLIGKDNRVKAAVVDLDRDDRGELQKIVAVLIDNEFYPYVERSKAKGYHVWIFFDEPIEAAIVRKVLSRILKEAGIGDIEIFPKQNSLNPTDGLGNYVFLPLHGGSIKKERTLFLTFHLKPYPDQWTHLSRVHLTKTENVLSLIKDIPEEAKPIQEKPDSILEGSLDVAKYLIHYSVPYKIKQEKNRTFYLLNRCLFADSHTTKDNLGDSSIVQDASGKLTYQCFHGHCKGTKWQDARKAISGDDSIIQFCQGYSQSNSDLKPPTIDRGLPKDLFQIIDEPEKEEIPLIEGVLYPGDKGFIVSMYKMGKTLFLMEMALCLSMGVPFLGFGIPRARKVLYIRFELKDSRFRKRLNIMLPALGGREMVKVTPYFHMTRGFDIKHEKDFSWLLNMIYKFEPEVLLLDPFYKLSITSNLKDAESANPIIKRFDNLMGRFPNLHVSIAHHLRKQSGGIKDDSWDSAYGPMQLFADMDYEIRISRKGNQKDTFVFSHISNDVPIENFTFKRNPISLLYELETKEDIRERWFKDADCVIEQVRNGGDTFRKKGNITTWIMETLKYSQRDAKDFLNFLLDEKKLLWVGSKTKGSFKTPDPKKDIEDKGLGLFQSGDLNQVI